MTQCLSVLRVKDSIFHCFIFHAATFEEIETIRRNIHQEHLNSSHEPFAWTGPADSALVEDITLTNDEELDKDAWVEVEPSESAPDASLEPDQVESVQVERKVYPIFDDDGEPADIGSVIGQVIAGHKETLAIVVRYFGKELLGVRSGRLVQCYRRVVEKGLYKYLYPDIDSNELMEWFDNDLLDTVSMSHLYTYGLGSGDTEIHHNFLDSKYAFKCFETFKKDLQFNGFKGAQNELLPRVQNLQANFYGETKQIIPIYRYPGNYSGDEWTTFPWHSEVDKIRLKVQESTSQDMNHCVTNYYRHGKDFIAHHTDKTVDIENNSVIVSVSLGGPRILELKSIKCPNHKQRTVLTNGSMLIIGPYTNQEYSHSILPVENSDDTKTEAFSTKQSQDVAAAAAAQKEIGGAKADTLAANEATLKTLDERISLTYRNIATFLDLESSRTYGKGSIISTNEELRKKIAEDKRTRQWYLIISILASLVIAMIGSLNEIFSSKYVLSPALYVVLAVIIGFPMFGQYEYEKIVKSVKDTELKRLKQEFSRTSLSGTKYT